MEETTGCESKDFKPIVPVFLQKLYEIVNNPRNKGLIEWSPRGDSFYVLDQDRLSREVLGHWFKHEKFTSFIRQLNMYGFRKVQNLQQHVAKSDANSRRCHFEHPHFIRDRPDLLGHIQRKKPASPALGSKSPVDLSPRSPQASMAADQAEHNTDAAVLLSGAEDRLSGRLEDELARTLDPVISEFQQSLSHLQQELTEVKDSQSKLMNMVAPLLQSVYERLGRSKLPLPWLDGGGMAIHASGFSDSDIETYYGQGFGEEKWDMHGDAYNMPMFEGSTLSPRTDGLYHPGEGTIKMESGSGQDSIFQWDHAISACGYAYPTPSMDHLSPDGQQSTSTVRLDLGQGSGALGVQLAGFKANTENPVKDYIPSLISNNTGSPGEERISCGNSYASFRPLGRLVDDAGLSPSLYRRSSPISSSRRNHPYSNARRPSTLTSAGSPMSPAVEPMNPNTSSPEVTYNGSQGHWIMSPSGMVPDHSHGESKCVPTDISGYTNSMSGAKMQSSPVPFALSHCLMGPTLEGVCNVQSSPSLAELHGGLTGTSTLLQAMPKLASVPWSTPSDINDQSRSMLPSEQVAAPCPEMDTQYVLPLIP